jgi:hypothetical protein
MKFVDPLKQLMFELFDLVASLPPKKFVQMMQFFSNLRDAENIPNEEFSVIFNFLDLKNEKFFEILLALRLIDDDNFDKKMQMIRLMRLNKELPSQQTKDVGFSEEIDGD